jgi:hypothetical protein
MRIPSLADNRLKSLFEPPRRGDECFMTGKASVLTENGDGPRSMVIEGCPISDGCKKFHAIALSR